MFDIRHWKIYSKVVFTQPLRPFRGGAGGGRRRVRSRFDRLRGNLILAALLNQTLLLHGRWVPEPWPTRPSQGPPAAVQRATLTGQAPFSA